MKIKYKKVQNNVNAIEINGKVVLSFDEKYKEYLIWKVNNPLLEQQLQRNLELEIECERLYNNGAAHKEDGIWRWYNEEGTLILKVKAYSDEERFDEKSQFPVDGEYEAWYDDGQREYIGLVKNDKEDGKWTYWFDNGKKRFEGTYKNGLSHGEWIYWYDDGSKWYSVLFKKGKEEGKYEQFSEGIETTVIVDGQYKNGKKDGMWTHYYENEQKSYEVFFINGKEDGKKTWWYNSGDLEKEQIYDKGKLSGKYVTYYRNGGVRSRGKMLNGEMEGRWVFNFHNGEKELESNFVSGTPVGTVTMWHDSGVEKYFTEIPDMMESKND
jgi:antitoxin component YwqK of YwqJK toxin-antitoxin module